MVDQAEIHRMAQSDDVWERMEAVDELRDNFEFFIDKAQAWKDLLALTKNKGSYMKRIEVEVSMFNFDRKIRLELIKDNSYVRKYAAETLGLAFAYITDKDQAWKDLLALTKDSDSDVRWYVAESLGLALAHVTDKDRAIKDLLALIKDEDSDVRRSAAEVLGFAFAHVTNKDQATKVLLELTKDGERYVRWEAVEALGLAFAHVTDKNQAWKNLMALTKDEDSYVREYAAEALGSAFAHVTDKEQATKDLLELTKDEKGYVRGSAAEVLGFAFAHVTNKDQATKILLELTKDKYSYVRWRAAKALGFAFAHVTDKDQATKDLLALIKDEDYFVRGSAANALGFAFAHVADKDQATKVLLALTKKHSYVRKYAAESNMIMYYEIEQTRDKDSDVRKYAAESLGLALAHVTDKDQATKVLLALIKDKDRNVREGAAEALGSAFAHVTDKDQATKDLLELTNDENSDVRWRAAKALGSAFAHVTDKDQATKNLMILTESMDRHVRTYAKYSLGRAYIFKATEAEVKENFRKELKKSLEFFESSLRERTFFKPAKFCYPLYRSFYTITFKKDISEAEVQKYLNEAKSAVRGSESKKKLLEAVENLSNALIETQKAMEMSLEGKKCELNAYRRYCDRAAELLETTEEKAPRATKLIKKGLPIIDKKIKELLREIEEKVNEFYKESQGTPFDKISTNVIFRVGGLGDTKNPINADRVLDMIIPDLRSIYDFLFPEESDRYNRLEEADLFDKAMNLKGMVTSISEKTSSMKGELIEKDKWVEYLKDIVLRKLDNISYGVFKLKLRSGEIVQSLYEVKNELDKLKTIQVDLNNFGLSLKDLENRQHQGLDRLNDEITRLIGEIEAEIIPKLPPNNDTTMKILEKLQDLKLCKEEIWFNRGAGLASIIGLIFTIL